MVPLGAEHRRGLRALVGIYGRLDLPRIGYADIVANAAAGGHRVAYWRGVMRTADRIREQNTTSTIIVTSPTR